MAYTIVPITYRKYKKITVISLTLKLDRVHFDSFVYFWLEVVRWPKNQRIIQIPVSINHFVLVKGHPWVETVIIYSYVFGKCYI